MEFSIAGVILSLAIICPSFILLGAPPLDSPQRMPDVPWVLTVLERVGQAGCFVLPALLGPPPPPDLWLGTILLCIVTYYGFWGRYLLGGRRFDLLYEPLGPLPVPMAVLPVAAFLAAAAWWGSWLLAALAMILAVGHISTARIIVRRTGP